MLVAYFDRSQIWRPTGIVSVSGGIAKTTEWEQFNREWQTVLDEEGIASFHMTDFETRQPPFDDSTVWIKSKRRRVLRRFIGVMRKRLLAAVGASLRLDEYDALSKQDRNTLGHPFRFCGMKATVMAIQAFDSIADGVQRSNPSLRILREPITFVFESGDEGAADLSSGLQDLRAEGGIGSMVQSWSFANKSEALGFQAADFIAYECSKHVSRAMGDESRPVRKSMIRFMRRVPLSGQYFDRGRLAEAAAELRRMESDKSAAGQRR